MIILILKTSLFIISAILIGLVLLQQQESGFYASSNMKKTRRGMDKLVYNLTIFFGIIFVVISISFLFVG